MKIQMTAAIEKDLGKTPFVTEMTSIHPVIMDIEYNLSHIDEVSFYYKNSEF